MSERALEALLLSIFEGCDTAGEEGMMRDIEMQRVWCSTCQRNGVYVFHWHQGHQLAPAHRALSSTDPQERTP